MPRRALALLLTFTAPACAQQPPELPLCRIDLAAAPRREAEALRPDAWAELIMRRGPSPLLECTGRALVDTPPGCDPSPTHDERPQLLPLADARALLGEAPPGHTLVWLTLARFPDGDAFGPVALIEWQERGIAIRGLGPLRASAEGAQLALHTLGDDPHARLLVVESLRCDPQGARCTPLLDLLPLRQGRFIRAPVHADDRCSEPSQIPLERSEVIEVNAGLHRRFRAALSVEITPRGVVLEESVHVDDIDPQRPQAAPRPYRHATETRVLSLSHGHLLASAPPLWPRMLAHHAAVIGPEEP
jgi:hypothetical protein